MKHFELQEKWQDRSLDRYSQELIPWAQFLHLLISWKALKSFMVTIVSHYKQMLHETSRHFLQKICTWLHAVVQSLSHVWPFGTSELQHARLSCPSPSPRVCLTSCSLSQGCHPTISSSVALFSSCFNLSQHQGLFQWVSSSHQVAKVLELQLQHQSCQWIFRIDFL